jgi:predicted transcriptional regulator
MRTTERPERVKVSVTAEHKARLDELARNTKRPVATVAARLLADVLESEDLTAALAAAQAEKKALEDELANATRNDEEPRWSWPLAQLLSDRKWWDRWLPELGPILGRPRWAGDKEAVDDRGFRDLLPELFPPLHDQQHRPVLWNHPDYGRWARLAAENANRPTNRELSQEEKDWREIWKNHGADRAQVWEPVIRHVCLGLAMLEEAQKDAYLAVRAKDELAGGWRDRLAVMIGSRDGRELKIGGS